MHIVFENHPNKGSRKNRIFKEIRKIRLFGIPREKVYKKMIAFGNNRKKAKYMMDT